MSGGNFGTFNGSSDHFGSSKLYERIKLEIIKYLIEGVPPAPPADFCTEILTILVFVTRLGTFLRKVEQDMEDEKSNEKFRRKISLDNLHYITSEHGGLKVIQDYLEEGFGHDDFIVVGHQCAQKYIYNRWRHVKEKIQKADGDDAAYIGAWKTDGD